MNEIEIDNKPIFTLAKINNLYDNIRVFIGSEEQIFGDTYMSCLVTNDRLVKFKKEVLEFHD